MDVRPDAREALAADQRPLELGEQTSTGRTAGPAGRSRRRSRWARPGSRSSRRSRRRRRGRRWRVRRAPGTDWTVEAVDRHGERLALRSRGTHDGSRGRRGRGGRRSGRGTRVRARRVEDGGPLVRRRGPPQDGGPDHRDEQQRPAPAAPAGRGRGDAGTGGWWVPARRSSRRRLYALPASADAATLGRDDRDPRAAERGPAPVLAGNDARRRPTGAAATSRMPSTWWSWAAGLMGLSAARRAAELGASVVLLEAERIGWGASTRNGGFCHPGFKQSLTALRRLHGVERAETPLPRDDRGLRARRAPVHDLDRRRVRAHRPPRARLGALARGRLRRRGRRDARRGHGGARGAAVGPADRDRQRRVLRRARRGAERRAQPGAG